MAKITVSNNSKNKPNMEIKTAPYVQRATKWRRVVILLAITNVISIAYILTNLY